MDVCRVSCIFIISALCLDLGSSTVPAVSAEYKVVTRILDQYDVNVRPVAKPSDVVNVYIGMAFNQIIELDEKFQSLKGKVWYRYSWKDVRLTWDPKLYENLTAIRILPGRAWVHDITLVNDLSTGIDLMDNRDRYSLTVLHDGTVYWNYPGTQESFCQLNMRNFPYDQQRCPMMYGSWTFDGSKLNLLNGSQTGDISVLSSHGEWEVIGMPLKRHLVYYKCCAEPYPDITFWLILQRKPMFYMYNLVMPSMVITFLAILAFYLPPDSGEKIALSVTVLLAMIVFLLLISESVPPQSENIPLLAQYFGVTIILMGLSTYMSVMVLHVHYKGRFGYPVPTWVRIVVLNGLGRVLCVKNIIQQNISKEKACTNRKMPDQPAFSGLQHGLFGARNWGKPKDYNQNNEVSHTMMTIMKETQESDKKKEEAEQIILDWTLVAMVLDRYLLVIFGIVGAVLNLMIFIPPDTDSIDLE